MGGIINKIKDKFFSKKLEICLLGLENSGKTTFVDQLNGKVKSTIPTIGLNVKNLKKGSNISYSYLIYQNKRRQFENLGYWWAISI